MNSRIYQQALNYLQKIENNMSLLNEIWNEDEDLAEVLNSTGKYPFEESFDEVFIRFMEFNNQVKNDIKTLTKL